MGGITPRIRRVGSPRREVFFGVRHRGDPMMRRIYTFTPSYRGVSPRLLYDLFGHLFAYTFLSRQANPIWTCLVFPPSPEKRGLILVC